MTRKQILHFPNESKNLSEFFKPIGVELIQFARDNNVKDENGIKVRVNVTFEVIKDDE